MSDEDSESLKTEEEPEFSGFISSFMLLSPSQNSEISAGVEASFSLIAMIMRFIMRLEGYKLKAYESPKGVWHYGFGHCDKKYDGQLPF